jgi:hypothetical protein
VIVPLPVIYTAAQILIINFDFNFDHSLVLDPAVGFVNSFDYARIAGPVHTVFFDSYGESQCFSCNNQLDFNVNDILLYIKFSNVNIACKFWCSVCCHKKNTSITIFTLLLVFSHFVLFFRLRDRVVLQYRHRSQTIWPLTSGTIGFQIFFQNLFL